MLRQLFNLAANAAVLFTALQGTQRQLRLTVAIAVLDAASIPPAEQPLHFYNYQPVCNDTSEGVAVQEVEIPPVVHVANNLKELYARTCWGIFAIVHAIVDIAILCHTQLFGRLRRHQHVIPVR